MSIRRIVTVGAGFLAFATHALADPVGPTLPWGIHLAYGDEPSSEMTVMWSTRDPVQGTFVRYGLDSDKLSLVAEGNATTFKARGSAEAQDIHLVRLTGLSPATEYFYAVGSDAQGAESSATAHFTTSPSDPLSWSPTIAIFGDMGISPNAQATLPWLLKNLDDGLIDVVAHIGDQAYNFQDDEGARGDSFMVQQEPLASRLPYHAGPGNHEDYDDFVHYRNRLGVGMPRAKGAPSGGGQGMFHSVNVGPIHFAFVNSEAYFVPTPHGTGLIQEQHDWLANDLASVDRTLHPWVVIGLHQPFYCSPNDDGDPCHKPFPFNPPRDGHLNGTIAGMEALAYQHGVDLVFGAHEHAYERFYPAYQSQWDETRTGAEAFVDYTTGPVNILTGAAGCPENMDIWQNTTLPFSALRLQDYGYSRLTAVNASHARLQYVDNQAGEVLDDIWIVRHSHGPF